MPCPGSALPIDQLIALAAGAGFAGADLGTAVAVAMAESEGGNPNCYNPESQVRGGTPAGLGSYGLWQIYAYKHPEFNPAQLLDPQYNAAAAFSVYQAAGYSFRPWTTYTSGAYMGFLGLVESAIAASSPAAPVDTSTDGTTNGGDGSSSGGGLTPAGTWPAVTIGAAVLALAWLWFRG